MTHAVLAFGRMNPPTTGHEKFIKKTHEVAKKVGGKAHVVASHSEGNSKNPIPQKNKIEYLKKVAHPDVHVSGSSKEHPTILHHASKLHAAGHKHLHVVAAGEREKEFHDKLHQYNGKSGKHGHYHFKSITVHSAGKRDPDSHGTEGVSGTKMRQHAHNNDHESFKKGLPKALHPHKDEIMNHIKTQKEDLDQEFEELVEAMTIQQRIKRKLIMRRNRPKINRMKRLYKKRKVPEKNLIQRSRKAGIRFVRKRVAGKKGTQYSKLSAAAKMHIDKKVSSQQKIVNNIARRLLPRTRKAELVRLQKNDVEIAFADYLEERATRKDGKPFARKDNPTEASKTKHDYKEKTSKKENAAPVSEQDLHSLFLKSEKGEYPFEVILEVFVRGVEDWDGGNNTPAQYAFNRVNSFIAGGKAYEMDYDLVEASSKRAADQTSHLKRKIARKSETLRSKQSVSSKSTTLFKRRHGGKTSQHRQDAGMGRSSSAEGGTRAKRPTGGITKMHKDLKNYSEKDFRRVHGKSKSAARQALARENYTMATGSAGMAQSEKPTPPRVKKKRVLEWGTDEATAHAKNMTPGEVNEKVTSPYTGAVVTGPKDLKKEKEHYKKMRAKRREKELGEGGLWDNIHAKRKRIKAGSGEKMRKPGSKGAPTPQQMKQSQESVEPVGEAAPLPTQQQQQGTDAIKDRLQRKNQIKLALAKRRLKSVNEEPQSYSTDLTGKYERRKEAESKTAYNIGRRHAKKGQKAKPKEHGVYRGHYTKGYNSVKEEADLLEKLGMDTHTDTVSAADQKEPKSKMKGRIKLYMMPKVNVKEDVEQVDELSRKTLGSYVSKASDARGHRKLSTKKVDNRYSGVALASKKLDKKNREDVKEANKPVKRPNDPVKRPNDAARQIMLSKPKLTPIGTSKGKPKLTPIGTSKGAPKYRGLPIDKIIKEDDVETVNELAPVAGLIARTAAKTAGRALIKAPMHVAIAAKALSDKKKDKKKDDGEDRNLSFEQWLEAYSASYAKPVTAGKEKGKKKAETYHSYQPVKGDPKQLKQPLRKRKTEVSWT